MPVYNGAAFIETAINSVLGQTFSDFELIVVDDGSTDETLSVARNACERDARVRVIALPHGGVSLARNRGIDEAKGEYLLFIDGDDTWHPDLLSLVFDAVNADTDLLVFGIALHRLAADGTAVGVFPELPEDGAILSCAFATEGDALFSRYNLSSPCNKVYRTAKVQERHTRFSPDAVYLEDLKFNLDYLCHLDNISIMQRNIYNYRVFCSENQIKKRRFGAFLANANSLFSSAEAFLKEKGIPFSAAPTLTGIVRNAYILEYLSALGGKTQKEKRTLFSLLKGNRGFSLVTAYGGRFFKLFRLLGAFGLSSLQAWLLSHKFSHGSL